MSTQLFLTSTSLPELREPFIQAILVPLAKTRLHHYLITNQYPPLPSFLLNVYATRIANQFVRDWTLKQWKDVLLRWDSTQKMLPLTWLRLHELKGNKPLGPTLPSAHIKVPNPDTSKPDLSFLVAEVNNGPHILSTAQCLDNCLAAWSKSFFKPNNHLLAVLNTTNILPNPPTKTSRIPTYLQRYNSKTFLSNPTHLSLALIQVNYTSDANESPFFLLSQHLTYENKPPEKTNQEAIATYCASSITPTPRFYQRRAQAWSKLNNLPPLQDISAELGFNIDDPNQVEHFSRTTIFSMLGVHAHLKNQTAAFFATTGFDNLVQQTLSQPLQQVTYNDKPESPSKG